MAQNQKGTIASLNIIANYKHALSENDYSWESERTCDNRERHVSLLHMPLAMCCCVVVSLLP